MPEVTYTEELSKAQQQLGEVDQQLNGKSQPEHYAALSLLFAVRELVLEVLEAFPEDRQTQRLYNNCRWRDIVYFRSMVYDLLVNKKARCALDIAKRYQSIVDILLVHFGPTKKKKVSISARKLTKNSLGQPDGVELTEDYMKREIGNTQIDLFSIEKRLKKGPVELLSERQEIAIELVRMREMFHQFLGEIEENASEEEYIGEIIEDFEEALHNDTEWMASIVVALVDDGECENVWKFIDRLKDFAQKIRAFFETKNHNSLKGPHILFPVPDESDEEDAEGDISFDTSLN